METVRWPPRSWKRQAKRIEDEEDDAERQRKVWRGFEHMASQSRSRVLGKGSYGEVYEMCSPRDPDKCVAVKPSCPQLDTCLEDDQPMFMVPSGEALVGLRLSRTVRSPNILATKMVQISNPNQDLALTQDLLDSSNVIMESVKPYRDGSSTLKDFVGSRANLRYVPDVLIQVVDALLKIRRKYPTFRHNDLHWENVLVSEWKQGPPAYRFGSRTLRLADGAPRAVIIDFGFATEETGEGELQTKFTISNALATAPDYNVRPDPSEWYDMMVVLLSIDESLGILYGILREIGLESIDIKKVIRPTAAWCSRVERQVRDGDVKTLEQWASQTALFAGRVQTSRRRRRRRRVRGGEEQPPFDSIFSPIKSVPAEAPAEAPAPAPAAEKPKSPSVWGRTESAPEGQQDDSMLDRTVEDLDLPTGRPASRPARRPARRPVQKAEDDTPTEIMPDSTGSPTQETVLMDDSGPTSSAGSVASRKRTLSREGASPPAQRRR